MDRHGDEGPVILWLAACAVIAFIILLDDFDDFPYA